MYSFLVSSKRGSDVSVDDAQLVDISLDKEIERTAKSRCW
jgi:hypothetical protein